MLTARSLLLPTAFVVLNAGVNTCLAAPTSRDYAALANEVRRSLTHDVLDQWFPRAVDRQRGGFHQSYAADWSRLAGEERSIVYQSRLTWLAAKAAPEFPARSREYQAYSKHGLDFLRDQMWDKEDGGLYWELDDRGQPVRDGEKHAYGMAFAIYAASTNYEITKDPQALDLAQRAFSWLDQHAHDAANGGYYEALRRDGTPILTPGTETNDFIGTRYGFKSMNTHIHLLEALTELNHIWPTAHVQARLREVFGLVRDTINVPAAGAMNLFFTPDWRAVPDHDSYGHDVETAFLLIEAAEALGEADEKTWGIARRLVDHALDFGYDPEHGGLYDAGGTFTPVTGMDKIWWVQAESLNALLLMHRKYGMETSGYWDAFSRQWNFIREHQIDRKNGGWFQSVSREGKVPANPIKSDRWTEGYHQGRALLNVSAALSKLGSGMNRLALVEKLPETSQQR